MNTPATVRIFPGYADTVLWLGVPVDYDATGLTQALVRDMRAWEQFYYDSLTPHLAWKSADRARQFTAEGNRLAELLAGELGEGYEVEFKSYEEDVPTRRFRGTRASNVRAVAAFDALAAELRAEQGEIARSRASAPSGKNNGWFATSPLSGRVFKPTEAKQE